MYFVIGYDNDKIQFTLKYSFKVFSFPQICIHSKSVPSLLQNLWLDLRDVNILEQANKKRFLSKHKFTNKKKRLPYKRNILFNMFRVTVDILVISWTKYSATESSK